MVADSTMSLLRITPRAVFRTRLPYRFDLDHRLSLSIEESSHPLVHTTNCPVHCYADQYDAHPFQRRMKINVPKLCKVRNFSSLRKPLLFTDDLLQKYIKQVVAEWNQIQKQLTDDEYGSGQPAAKHISKRRSFLEPVVSKVMQHQQCSATIAELEDIISASTDKDIELSETAEAEIADLKMQLMTLEDDIVSLLLPPLVGDDNDIILEVNAGVGGQEAMLFTKEVFEMYMNYASFKGWSVNIVNYDVTDVGGLRHAVAAVSGPSVFLRMKFEGGVHRVQRVPKTEKSGRMHTSTVTVAILSQPSEIDIVLNPRDLRVETCRASGKGGQNINKSQSAVRIVYLPTGMAAECQMERTQIRNKEIAMTLLRSRLYEKELEKSQQQLSSTRKLQVGSAGRSEKIRTYNMRDDRVTDHRINENVYGVSQLLSGGKQLDELIDTVQMEARYERLMDQLQRQQHTNTSSADNTTSS